MRLTKVGLSVDRSKPDRGGRSSALVLSRRAFVAALAAASFGEMIGAWTPMMSVPATHAAERRSASLQDGDILQPSARAPGQLSPLVVSNEAFYYVTKNALNDPVLDPTTWRLVVQGEVDSPVQVDYSTLLQLPATEIGKTLECISNRITDCEVAPFGCELISNAIWKGTSLPDVLSLSGGLKGSAVNVVAISADEFSSSIPVEAALDPETILAYEMNGQALPQSHGAPVRLLVPGRYGFKSAKWLREIRATSRPVADWYGQRNWSQTAIVKTMSRIDTPAPGAALAAGSQTIAGIAYGGDRGISRVEYSADGGQSWRTASFLEPQLGRDTWVRWQGAFDMPAGATLTLVSRAIDGTGQVQTRQEVPPQPDGASGWRSIQVTGA